MNVRHLYLVFVALLVGVHTAEGDKKSGSRLANAFETIQAEQLNSESEADSDQNENENGSKLQRATFGNGCFWCTEAVFEELHGVTRVASGYSGGKLPNPTYKQVCTGLTGHAEVIHIEFDPSVISYAKLLEVFWRTHDPTTKNRQGPDVGTQYRSVVFYHNDDQKELAQKFKTELNRAHAFRKPIVTEIAEFKKFYVAERYHQDYFKMNGRDPYCQRVIRPKMSKFRRVFADELKRNKRNSK